MANINNPNVNTAFGGVNQTNPVGGVNGAAYKMEAGFQKQIQNLAFYSKMLLKSLTLNNPNMYTKYLSHEIMPERMGDTIYKRRYLGLEANPDKLKMDKNSITGPALKTMRGVSVGAKLEWYGNGVGINDYESKTAIDNLMSEYLPFLRENIIELTDNIAAKATYDGASKIFLGKLSSSGDQTFVNPETGVVNDYGPLNIDVLRALVEKFKTNRETYTGVIDGNVGDITSATTHIGTVSTKAPIKPFGQNYIVLVGSSAKADLLSDPKYLSTFVNGQSSTSLRQNSVPTQYNLEFVEVQNKITADVVVGTGTAKNKVVSKLDWSGKLDVSFIIGREYGFDVKFNNNSVQLYTVPVDRADSHDIYARQGTITFKLAYAAKVCNSRAVYAIITKPLKTIANNNIVQPTVSAPLQ